MATTTFNFDSYTTGALNGQDSWTADLSADFDVSTAQSVSPSKSIRRKTGGNWSGAWRGVTATASGSVSFRARMVGTHADPYRGLQVNINSGGSVIFTLGSVNTNTAGVQGSTSENIGSFSTNTWYLFEGEWDYATQKIRGRFNGGSWSSWLNPATAWTTLNQVGFFSLNQEFFIDDVVWTTAEAFIPKKLPLPKQAIIRASHY